MRNALRVFLMAVLIAGGSILINRLLLNVERISVASYQQIKIGMTKNQVENLLGGPPRWVVRPRERDYVDLEDFGNILDGRADEWWGHDGIIQVWYQNGFVTKR